MVASLQSDKVGPIVDMEHLAVKDQGWDRVNTRRLGLGQAFLRLTEVDDLDTEPSRVKGGGKVPLRLNTDRASSMIENRIRHHYTY